MDGFGAKVSSDPSVVTPIDTVYQSNFIIAVSLLMFHVTGISIVNITLHSYIDLEVSPSFWP